MNWYKKYILRAGSTGEFLGNEGGGEIIDRAIREDLIEKYVEIEYYREGVKSKLVQELAEITGLNPDSITDLSPKAVGDLIDIESLPENQQKTIRNLVTDYGDATERMRKLQTERKRIDAPFREFVEQAHSPQVATGGRVSKKAQINDIENQQEILPDEWITLYRGMNSKFNSNFELEKTDAPYGYSTWTDNKELAKQYAGKDGYVYKITLPKSKMGEEIIDNSGERVLFFNNEKAAGLNNISGNEYLVYTQHDDYSPNLISLAKKKYELV